MPRLLSGTQGFCQDLMADSLVMLTHSYCVQVLGGNLTKTPICAFLHLPNTTGNNLSLFILGTALVMFAVKHAQLFWLQELLVTQG